jgi:SAM-dependent methyltransferase
VNDTVSAKLLALNSQFYQTFAIQFSDTRQSLQPGVRRLLEQIPAPANLLDLGCGNGALARQLALGGFAGRYVGVDLAERLLALAGTGLPPGFQASFHRLDLAAPDWETRIPDPPFDYVFAFAVLHHLPGEALRRQVLDKVHLLLASEGCFLHSEWQFLNSPRLRQRLLPWDTVGLSPEEVDPGDALLDWKQGGYGLRYVHQFSEPELARLAAEAGFTIQETFYSDGKEGDLGLYQVWMKDTKETADLPNPFIL